MKILGKYVIQVVKLLLLYQHVIRLFIVPEATSWIMRSASGGDFFTMCPGHKYLTTVVADVQDCKASGCPSHPNILQVTNCTN
jgi:hypothetical protein